MSEQLSFGGLGPARQATPRPAGQVYFALLPDEPAAARCALLARQVEREAGLRAEIMHGRFHVSLHGIGRFPDLLKPILDGAMAAAAGVAAAPFEIAFDRVASFGGRAVVLMGPAHEGPTRVFFAALGMALGRVLPRLSRSFTPHLTLMYADRRVPVQEVEPIGWTVRELVLVHSHHGHEVLGRWPLRG